MNSGSPYLDRISCDAGVVQVKPTNTAFSRMTPLMEGMTTNDYMNEINYKNGQLNTQINNYHVLRRRNQDNSENDQIRLRDKMEMDIQEYIQHENTTLLLGAGTLTILLIATLILTMKR
jgi:hypothetical protein